MAGSASRFGFTLAEVLITLGIIGVVAALTMPSLIQHHRKQVVSAQLKKFYSLMSQAVITAQVQEGVDVQDWDTFSSIMNGEEIEKWFNKYLKNYLNITKTELKNNILYVYLNDGTGFAIFNYNVGRGNIHLYFYPKMGKPNCVLGKDRFTFQFNNNKFTTYWEKSPLTTEQMMSTSQREGCHKNSGTTHGCSTVIQRNGWQIPDNYPFRF